MRNDFMPVHLMNANAKLDKHVLADKKKNLDVSSEGSLKESLWQKFVGLFKR